MGAARRDKTLCKGAAIALTAALAPACADMERNERELRKDAVYIGLEATLTGALANLGLGIENAARLAVLEINAAGGVNGQPLEIIARDTKLSTTNVAKDNARRLVDAGVVGIVGSVASSSTLAVAQAVTIAARVPIISPGSTSPAITDLDDADTVYRTIASDAFQGVVLAGRIYGLGVKTTSALAIDNAYGRGLLASFKQRYTELGGQVVAEATYPESKTIGFGVEVAQILAPKPEGVLLIGYATDTANATRDIAAVGPAPGTRFFGVDGNFDAGLLKNGDVGVLRGMLGTAPTPSKEAPNFQAFAAAYRARLGEDPPLFSETSYDAVYLMAYAMAKAGANTREAILTNLRGVSRDDGGDEPVNVGEAARALAVLRQGQGIDYRGASGPVDLDDKGDVTSGTYVIWQVEDGGDGLRFREIEAVSAP